MVAQLAILRRVLQQLQFFSACDDSPDVERAARPAMPAVPPAGLPAWRARLRAPQVWLRLCCSVGQAVSPAPRWLPAILLVLWGGAILRPQQLPQRIVSTAPSITEMLYALGLGDRVVGVTTFCHYPPEAARKPKIGNYLRPDVETIVALRPDLVIAETSMIRQAIALPRLKLNLLEVDDATIQGIYDSIRKIGAAAGVSQRATALCGSIAGKLEAIQQRSSRSPRRRVLFIVGRTPGRIEDLIAAGGTSYLNELMRIAGGENVFQDAAIGYGKIGLEEILARNPDVIIDMGEMAQTVGITDRQKQAVIELWRRYPTLKAVRNKQVFAVASDVFVVPGPRVTEAAGELASMLHPEAAR